MAARTSLPAPAKGKASTAAGSDLVHEVQDIVASAWSNLNACISALDKLAPMMPSEVRRAIELRMKTAEPPMPALLDQARRNAAARDAFIAECGGLLTSAQVAELAGSDARNVSQLAWRLKDEGRIFSVDHRGRTFYPALQFDPQTGRPREVIKELIAILEPLFTGWSLALWFATANDWLDGARPVELLANRPKEALEAASAEVSALDV